MIQKLQKRYTPELSLFKHYFFALLQNKNKTKYIHHFGFFMHIVQLGDFSGNSFAYFHFSSSFSSATFTCFEVNNEVEEGIQHANKVFGQSLDLRYHFYISCGQKSSLQPNICNNLFNFRFYGFC
ncbi:hypothetical protein AABB24_014404 [Solanum stoloniferum]|uniref:Uncharacterized protein n=1 Tax=Solanum stoloniferum TaxID=62892 RepID=A0ABD2TZ01_9SOLN